MPNMTRIPAAQAHKNGTQNGTQNGHEPVPLPEDSFLGPHTGLHIKRPSNPKVHLEKKCNYQGPGDALHQPCRGTWHPWYDFSANNSKPDGLQDACTKCIGLRRRNDRKKRLGLLSNAAIKHDIQLEEGRKMADAEEEVTTGELVVVVVPDPLEDVTTGELVLSVEPTLEELHRVGAYLSRFKFGRGEIEILQEKARQQELELGIMHTENELLNAANAGQAKEIADLLVEIERLKKAEETADGLAQAFETELKDEREAHAETVAALKLQVEYQGKLLGVGMTIPEKYRLAQEGT